MKNLNRRDALQAVTAGAVVIGTAGLTATATATADEPKAAKLWTLEGELQVHQKYLYRYYLVLGDLQRFPLYGQDHDREPEQLTRLKVPVRVRVRGTLGAEYHAGGTKGNPSPFPTTWTVFMDVHEVEVLK